MADWRSFGDDLPASIDGPRGRILPRRMRWGVALFVAAVLAIILGSRTVISYWVDLLWFQSLGYGDVFWKTLSLQWTVFAIFALATFALLYGSLRALLRAHRFALPRDHSIVVAGQPVILSVEPALRIIALCISLLVAVVAGASMLADWPTLALFWYAPRTAANLADPIFGRPLSFFLFTLPAIHLILSWLLTLAVFATSPPSSSFSSPAGLEHLELSRQPL